MKNQLLLTLTAFIFTFNISAQTLQKTEGNIRFISDKKGITAETNSFKSEINVQKKSISFTVYIADFLFKKKKMQTHFNNKGVMSSALFPEANFKGKIICDADLSISGTYDVVVTGMIKIRDVEKEYSAKGSIKITSAGVAVSSEFIILREDFNIKGFYASMTDDLIKVYLVSVYK